jgi:osmotically inducible protein OsmC
MDPLYVASATATGGRTGRAVSSDGALDVNLVIPKELGGPGEGGTNPEQLFAAGFSSCFLNALQLLAAKREIDTGEATVTADVAMHGDNRGVHLTVTLHVSLPGVEREMAEKLVSKTEVVCPYSNATRGNVDLQIKIEEPVAVA